MSEQRSNDGGTAEPGDANDSGAWRASGSSERILGLWPAASPPSAFADDVIDAAAAAATRGEGRRRTATRLAAGALAVVVTGAIVLLVRVVAGSHAEPGFGARIAERRETLRIGERAVAVAEPGAALAWRVGDAALVEQSRGNVFYRVDRGETPFGVTTPAGRVAVLGTCFRVDVAEGSTTVAVYEGVVSVENERGRLSVSPGEQAVLSPGRVPIAVPLPWLAAHAQLPPAAPSATPAELLARERAYRAQIAALRGRASELENQLAVAHRSEAIPDSIEPGRPPTDKYDGFSHDELAWMARKCELRYDLPGYAYATEFSVKESTAAQLGVSAAEREAIDRINREGDPKLVEQTKDLYAEITGDRTVADALEPRTLQHEIFLKSRRGDEERATQRLSAERAGLARPPSSLSGLPPVERLLRLLAASGDQYEQRLAAVFGAKRAAELRHQHVGMGLRVQAGCPEN